VALDFELTDEQRAVRDLAGRIAAEVLSEAARTAEQAKTVGHEIWRKIAQTGLAPAIPEQYGGGGLPDALASFLSFEAFAHGDAAMTSGIVWSANAAFLLAMCGTESQRSEHLPALAAKPECRAGIALYEGFGRAPSEYRTNIELQNDGRWRVIGRKVAVPYGRAATPLIVVGNDPGSGCLRAAILTPHDSGVVMEQNASLIGLAAAPTENLKLEVVLSAGRLLGGANGDPELLARAVAHVRLTTAFIALGCAQRAVEYASHYATERIAFGRPISQFQGTAFLMADAQVQINAARLESLEVASRLATAGVAKLERSVSMAVSYACAAATRATRDAVQVLGGHGFITDHPVERWYRAAAGLSTLDFDVTCSAFSPVL
jgi:alkylation response protein AidB-like acyl-CoA dehydrogenase